MDRVLAALANRSHVAIVRCLLSAGEAMTNRDLRIALGVASKDRAHFGRQVQQLYDLGVLERDDRGGDGFVVAEPDLVERFLLQAADLEAALDARRAERSRARARALRKDSIARETRRIPPA